MTRPPRWCAQYVGKPFVEKGRGQDGYDCWGLVRAVLDEIFGVSGLPDYVESYTSTGDRHSVSAAVRAGLLDGWHKVPNATQGTLVILRLAGRPWHCAVAVNKEWMLHAVVGSNVCLERLDSMVWSDRIEGFYRRA